MCALCGSNCRRRPKEQYRSTLSGRMKLKKASNLRGKGLIHRVAIYPAYRGKLQGFFENLLWRQMGKAWAAQSTDGFVEGLPEGVGEGNTERP